VTSQLIIQLDTTIKISLKLNVGKISEGFKMGNNIYGFKN
jgi:hypothetical protein